MALQLPLTNEAMRAGGNMRKQFSPLRRFRPGAFGLIALALSICVWSSASKLDRYHIHSDPTVRASLAKMWMDTRNARALTDVLRKAAIEWPPTTVSPNITEYLTTPVDLGPAEQAPPRLAPLAPIVSLLPSRSPPKYRFCLA